MSRLSEIAPEDCPFCRILRRELPARFVYEDEAAVAFRDLHPVAPVHVLVIPRVHVPSAEEARNPEVWGGLMTAVVRTADALGLKGYRLVVNCGEEAGQTIPHLHVHILAEGRFLWPPGVGEGGPERGEVK
jgi:histidine triad (HIT) family protein